MKSVICLTIAAATINCLPSLAVDDSGTSTNALIPPRKTTIQEMLIVGPSALKLHALAMISQGNAKGGVDESYMPGFKVCSEDSTEPVRAVTARVLGDFYVTGNDEPSDEAIAILLTLASDESRYVRFNAAYYGLSQIQNKSDDVVAALIDVAAAHPEDHLYERIVNSLKDSRDQAVSIMDKLLHKNENIAIFEIYKDIAETEPSNADKFLSMPSSRPHLLVVSSTNKNPDNAKELLNEILIKNKITAEIQVSGQGDNFALMVKTYITGDRLNAISILSDHPQYNITEAWWLTPEVETVFELLRKQKH
jgi:hypothetical protein